LVDNANDGAADRADTKRSVRRRFHLQHIMDQVTITRALQSMPAGDRELIQSVAPDLMRLAGTEGFVVDLDEDYIKITGERRNHVINDKLRPHFLEGENFLTEKTMVRVHCDGGYFTIKGRIRYIDRHVALSQLALSKFR